MKIRIEYITKGPEELVLYTYQNPKLSEKEQEGRVKKILGNLDGEQLLLMPSLILYFEAVDGKVFAYLPNQVIPVSISLEKIELRFMDLGFIRVSKSLVINIREVNSFKSMIGNRMIATMSNDEQLIISRHYSRHVRDYLKEETSDE